MRQLIICADDYAQDPAIDTACRELLAAGRLTAVSCMVLSPRWPAAARELRASAAAAEVGLHLDLTHGWAGRTRCVSLGSLMLQTWLRVVDRAWVNAEICRQLDDFERVWGSAPDFVDGHQHVHQLPVIREALLAEMEKRYGGLAQRPWIRSTWSSRPPRGLKARVLQFLGGAGFRKAVAAAGFACNADFIGVYAFDATAAAYRLQLKAWLEECRDGTVLMCHPAQQPVAEDPIAAARVVEFEVLRDDRFPALLAACRIGLKSPDRV